MAVEGGPSGAGTRRPRLPRRPYSRALSPVCLLLPAATSHPWRWSRLNDYRLLGRPPPVDTPDILKSLFLQPHHASSALSGFGRSGRVSTSRCASRTSRTPGVEFGYRGRRRPLPRKGTPAAAIATELPMASAAIATELPMASAATWGLASPAVTMEGRVTSQRQTLGVPHCLGLPPHRRLQRAGASSAWTVGNGTIKAHGKSTTTRVAPGETSVATSEATGKGDTELPEVVKKAVDAWDKVEDKYAVAAIGAAAIVALWASTGLISAIDRLPLIPGVLELVGIGYTGWFIYQNLVFKPDREALTEKIKTTYDKITGTS